MQIDEQVFLSLVEETNRLAFVDIEATGLRGDYNSVLVVSVKPYGEAPYSFTIKQVGNDQKVVRDVKEDLEQYDVWCGYYSKGFDLPMLNTRLLKWGQKPIEKRHHIDLYYTLKHNTLMSRRSLAQVAGLLELHDQKMGVSPNVWSEIPFKMSEHMPTMVDRCESDVTVLEQAYDKTKHLIKEIKR